MQNKTELRQAREQIIYLHENYAAPSSMGEEQMRRYIERVKRHMQYEDDDLKRAYNDPPKRDQIMISLLMQ